MRGWPALQKDQARLDHSEKLADAQRPAWLPPVSGQTLQLSIHIAFHGKDAHGAVDLVGATQDGAGGLEGRPELSLLW